MEVAGCEVKQFLNASARIIEHAEEYVITFSMPGQTIDLCQQVTKFVFTQIAQNGADCLLGGYSQNRAAQSGQSWLPPRDVAKEGLNPRQPRIACPGSVAPIGFQISQKIQYQWTREVLNGEFIDGTFAPRRGILQQQLHGVPV
jgi:hypothetical protein